ncbi:MAG TPA: outer membrane protein transport protein [Chitinophagaceae bacterium]
MKKTLIALLLALISTTAFQQNGTKLIAFDAKTAGRGGTSTGSFDAGSLMMNNPAGLSFINRHGIDLSFSLMAPKVHFTNALNDADGKDNLFPMGMLSFTGRAGRKLSYGAGVFTQGGMGADFNLKHSLYRNAEGQYAEQPYHSKFAVMHAGGSLAWQPSPAFSIGLTASLVYSQMEFSMPMSMSPSMLKGVIDPSAGYTFGNMFSAQPAEGGLGYSEVVASAEMKQLHSYKFNGRLGIAWQPSPHFSAGVCYTLPVNMEFKNGEAYMDMTAQMNDAFAKVVAGIMMQHPGISEEQAMQSAMTQFAELGIDLSKGAKESYRMNAGFGLPQSVAAGLSFDAGKKIRLAVDVEWLDWSHSFDRMDLEMRDGSNPNINRMMGIQGSFSMPFPLEWKNSVIVRTGISYKANSILTLRGGYAYGNNPVPAETLFPVFPAVVEHHTTLGAGIAVSKSISLNLAWEHAIENNEHAATNGKVGAQFSNSSSSLANNIFHISGSWTIR